MSFTDFKEILVNNPGTSLRYGGNDLKEIMQILNAKTVSNRRPEIINEWIWMDHFDMAPPAIVPSSPTDANASRLYIDPTNFRLKLKKTAGTILDLENVDIPETALLGITSKNKIPATVAYEDEANTFTQFQTLNKAAEAAVAEELAMWKLSDDTLSYIKIVNASATDGSFVPWIRAYNSAANTVHPGFYLYSAINSTQDTGTIPVLIFDSRRVDNTAITTRPLADFRTANTSVFKISPTIIDTALSLAINKTSQAGVGELVAEFKVSDDALSKLDIINASSTDAQFVPQIRSYFRQASAAQPGLYLFSHIPTAQDSGTVPAFIFDARKDDNAAITTRPVFDFRTAATSVFKLSPTSIDTPLTLTLNKASQAGVAEILASFKVSDDANSFLNIQNNSGTDTVWAAKIQAHQQASSGHPGLAIWSTIHTSHDTGVQPGMVIDVRRSDAVALATRPLLEVRNAGTSVFKINPTTYSLTGTVVIDKTSQAGIAEVLQEWRVSDDSLSKIDVVNASATDAFFVPLIRGWFRAASASHPGLYLFAHIPTGQDSGTTAAFIFDARKDDAAAIATRPLFRFRNAGTSVFEITPTAFDFTSKTLTNAILGTTVSVGTYIDFDDTTTPANPAAGFRRIFADSANGSRLSALKSDGTVLNLEAGAAISTLDSLSDVVITSVAVNQVPTWDGTNWVNAAPPGAGGGEANTGSNIGTAGTGIFKQKVGVNLELYKLNTLSTKLSLALDAGNNKIDFDVVEANLTLNNLGGSISTRSKLPTPVVYDDEANTYGDFDQIFRSSRLLITNPANTFNYTIVGSAITAGRTATLPLLTANDTFLMQAFATNVTGRKRFTDTNLTVLNPALTFQYIFRSAALTADIDVTFPLLAANDIFVFEAFAQPLTNKTINASLNTITNIADAAIAATGITTRSKLPAALVYDDEANTWGDFNQIFLSSRLLIQSPTDTPTYIIAASSITANRTATLPLLTTNDTFVMALHPQTLQAKTISGSLNTITEITDAAISASGITTRSKLPSPVAYEDEVNTFTLAQGFLSYQNHVKITPPVNPALEEARTYFKQTTGNNNTMAAKQKINGAIREVRAF